MHANDEHLTTNIITTMRRNLPICSDFDEDLMDDFGEFDDFDDDAPQPNRSTTTPVHSDNWTIVNAFNVINEELPKSQLGTDLDRKSVV